MTVTPFLAEQCFIACYVWNKFFQNLPHIQYAVAFPSSFKREELEMFEALPIVEAWFVQLDFPGEVLLDLLKLLDFSFCYWAPELGAVVQDW